MKKTTTKYVKAFAKSELTAKEAGELAKRLRQKLKL